MLVFKYSVFLTEDRCGHKGLDAGQHRELKYQFAVTSAHSYAFTSRHGLVQEEQLTPEAWHEKDNWKYFLCGDLSVGKLCWRSTTGRQW